MNYLAHLYFAGEDQESILGNFLGDFIKGEISKSAYSRNIQSGIALHRRIDRVADDKIISLLETKDIVFKHRRYAGITFDLACDHFLAKHWQEFHSDAIENFAAHRIDVLKSQEKQLPESGKRVLNRMIQYQWLENYQDLEFLEQVFRGIHKRFPRENTIDLAFTDLQNNYTELQEGCSLFIKQLQKELLP